MRIDDLERDLKVIRQAIELSSRYTNITARGYFFAGIVAVLGTWQTYLCLGSAKLANLALLTPADLQIVTLIWGLVFVAAIGIVLFFSWRKARKNHVSAWNSLTARMLCSQLPLFGVAGIITVALAFEGCYGLIPGIWLGLYGVVLYSCSYYTGLGQKIEGSAFIAFGSVALFAPGALALLLLGAGFGGVHIVSGVVRRLARGQAQHESERVE